MEALSAVASALVSVLVGEVIRRRPLFSVNDETPRAVHRVKSLVSTE